MATIVQRRRGSTAQHAAFTGALGELTVDTDKNTSVLHDGATAGGFVTAAQHLAQTWVPSQIFANTENFFGSTATNDNSIKFINPAGAGTSTFDFNTNGTPNLNFFRKYNTTPFQIEMAASGSMDYVIDSNNNETGSSVRFLTNGIRGSGTQTLLFTIFDNTNATLVGDFTANKLLLPDTTSATVGGIYFGGLRAFHNFGTSNVFIGINAGNFTMTGIRNVGVGAGALIANTTGTRLLAIGHNALISNTIGENNVALGTFTLFANTTGVANVAIGSSSLAANIDGMLNVAIGVEALTSNISGLQNVAIGSEALYFTTGSNNIGIGHGAVTFNTSGLRNIGLGTNALLLTTGSNNIGLGYQAGNNLTTGSTNIIIGYEIDSPTATNSNTLTIGNLIFGTGIDGTGTTISSGNIGIGVITPLDRLHVGGRLRVDTGFFNDAGGFKHARVTTGSVGAGTTALVTITWATAFADTNYTVNASVLDATTSSLSLSVVHIETITAAAVTVRVLNNAIGALTGTVHVIAVHD